MLVFPPAFKHRNFRLFWTANATSLIGSLAQDAARGWLVRSLTHDPFLVSAVAACTSLPVLLFTLYAGAVADRVDKRLGLMVTNSMALVLALVLWALTYWKVITVPQLALLSLLTGTVNAFDIPIRQSMNIEMVGREDLPNAIALNSTAFNGARVLGPAVGGALIKFVGTAGCFFVNALSFVPLVWNLRRMDLAYVPDPNKKAIGFADMSEGFRYVRAHPTLWPLVSLVAVSSVFSFSYSNLLPIFAKDVFLTDEGGYSAMLSSAGAGSLGAAGQLALSGRMGHKGRRLFGGAIGFCVAIAAFAFAPNLIVACGCLFAGGYCLLTFLTTANTLVQTTAPDELRGRVFSLYSLALIGTAPIGALWVGKAAQLLGTRVAVEMGVAMGLAWTIWTLVANPQLRNVD
ncbi:MFS transporter [bacterium]|nr:MAG: MFS transporter [bacterium]